MDNVIDLDEYRVQRELSPQAKQAIAFARAAIQQASDTKSTQGRAS
jgi:hypothetical protein